MPDSAKNMEIEDVLASIRRLVSDEPVERRPADAVNTRDDSEKTAKLVLTADFLVRDNGGASGDESSVAQADTVQEADQTDAEEMDADPWEEVSLEERIAELEAAVAISDDDWEPDGSEDDGGAVDFEEVQATRMWRPQEASVDVVEDAEEESDPVEAFEPAFVDGEDDAEEAAQVASDKTHEDGERHESVFDDVEDVLDEEALRQLVTDIVRQELQGELGDRITRNVRKLVRREINRALSSRDLE